MVAVAIGSPARAAVSVAVVVGSNQSPAAGTPALHYADDDAVKGARTLALLGARTFLLVAPDDETRELFAEARAATRRPTRAAVAAALADAFASLRAAQGPTRLYFFFAGHGDVAGGRPFLQLEDGRLFRDDLATLLADSPADEHHVVIDACYAAQFVGDRGPGGARAAAAPGFSQAAGPRWPRRTGLFTARSLGDKTHEWTEFQAGIFSHEVRSGLSGAADADRDGRVSYRELGAFVRRANEAIANRKYRPEVITQPPAGDADATFAELPDGPLVLAIDNDVGRGHVDAENGVRVVDLHPAPGLAVDLRLPTDLGALFLQRADAAGQAVEIRIEPRPGRVLLSSLSARPARAQARGAAHEAFRLLFARQFDQTVVRGFEPDLVAAPAPAPGVRLGPRFWPWAITTTGVLANATSLGLGLWGHKQARDARGVPGAELGPRIQSVERANQGATIAGAIGISLMVAGLTWLWLTPAEDKAHED